VKGEVWTGSLCEGLCRRAPAEYSREADVSWVLLGSFVRLSGDVLSYCVGVRVGGEQYSVSLEKDREEERVDRYGFGEGARF
jgi:hypothetical protein